LLNIFFIAIIKLEKIILEIFFGIYFQKHFKRKEVGAVVTKRKPAKKKVAKKPAKRKTVKRKAVKKTVKKRVVKKTAKRKVAKKKVTRKPAKRKATKKRK